MAKRVILVVEDETDLAKILARRLIDHDFEVSIATDAYQGISSTMSEHPSLVILDLMLPAGGGLSVLKNMRLNPKTMNIPVVVITGIKDPEYEKKVLAEGVQAYFQKPYEFTVVLQKIKELLKME